MISRTVTLGLCFSFGAWGAADLPGWLSHLTSLQTAQYGSETPAVVLFEERHVKVDPSGRVVTSVRKAVRVLQRAGVERARGSVVYRTDTGKVRSLEGWLLYPSGNREHYGAKQTVDLALVDNDVYNEARVRIVSAAGQAEPGAVFGYESVLEDRSVFTQFSHRFQDTLPALTSRFLLDLPNGWTARGITLNHEQIEPLVKGSSYVWQLDNLQPVHREPAQPNLSSLAPRLAVGYFASGAPPAVGPSFANWQDVSAWLATLHEPQSQPDESVSAKARSLTQGAGGDFERISSIGRFVQAVNYVSIQTGVGRGGGYSPHPASEVLSKSYGDCKDKVNLMRAMLRTVGVSAHPVAIYAGDRDYVQPRWASPQQFNHAIIAIGIPRTVDAPAVLEHERFGRLLLFDPTDPYTPLGHLPQEQQGSWALIVAAEGGELLRAPSTRPRDNLLRRTVQLRLEENGSIAAEIHEDSVGAAAAEKRMLRRGQSSSAYRKVIEKWISRAVTGAEIAKLETSDTEANRFTMDVEFNARGYGRIMGGRLMIFRPAVVSRRSGYTLVDDSRRYPVVLSPASFEETVAVEIPSGFSVDEKPPDVHLEHEFGRYSASWVDFDGQLNFHRELTLLGVSVSTEDYPAVRDFFRQIMAAEQAPVVLVKE